MLLIFVCRYTRWNGCFLQCVSLQKHQTFATNFLVPLLRITSSPNWADITDNVCVWLQISCVCVKTSHKVVFTGIVDSEAEHILLRISSLIIGPQSIFFVLWTVQLSSYRFCQNLFCVGGSRTVCLWIGIHNFSQCHDDKMAIKVF
jgi:hypothetical protein